MLASILVVEDDKNLREALSDNLELEGYRVFAEETLESAKKVLSSQDIDLILLDVMLPDGTGFDLCKWAREKLDVLILMLTALNMEKDIVEGFISGCDDYVSKPYRSAELLLRIQALLRRKRDYQSASSKELGNTLLMLNGFQINWDLREIKRNNEGIHLTKTAFDILTFLHANLNVACSRDQILDAVWGEQIYVDNRTVDNFVSNLKKQLRLSEGNDYYIQTIRGLGYALKKETK